MASLQYKVFSRLMSSLPFKLRLKLLFFRRFRYFLDLNNPVTFNEKIQYKKVFDRSDLLYVAADKIASKDFVREISPELYIPETLVSFNSSAELLDINLKKLPPNYVFKANHTSQTIEIIKNSNHLPIKKMKSLAESWLKHDQASTLGEWAYQNIPRKVFIEEFLDFNGREPDDYKFFVYHGKVHFIQLDSDRFIAHKRNMFDRDWNDLEIDFSHSRKTPPPKKPVFIESMIEIAEAIGANFDFIRVDLYWYKNMVTFGELTVYPGAGFEKFPTHEWDVEFGKPWKQNYLSQRSTQ